MWAGDEAPETDDMFVVWKEIIYDAILTAIYMKKTITRIKQ